MKKTIGILALALVLTLAMAVPAMAEDISVTSDVCVCTETIACTVTPESIDFDEVTPGVKVGSSEAITVTNDSTSTGDDNNPGGCTCVDPDITATASVSDDNDAHYAANLYVDFFGFGNLLDGADVLVTPAATETLANNVTFDVPDGLAAGTYTGTITITCEGA